MRILGIKNAKFSAYCFYMKANIYGDFQICISVPLMEAYECVYPNGHSFLCSEIPNYKVVTKWPSFFYSKMQHFKVVRAQTAIRFSQRNTKFWKLQPNGHSSFYNEIQNFESCTKTVIRNSHKEIRILSIYHHVALYFKNV